MAIKETCPKCQTTYELNDRLQGSTVRCKQCEGTFVVAGKAPSKAIVATPPPARAKPTEIIEEALHVILHGDLVGRTRRRTGSQSGCPFRSNNGNRDDHGCNRDT